MAKPVKGLLIFLVSTVLGALSSALVGAAIRSISIQTAALVSAIIALLYGLEAGILSICDLGAGIGWLELLIDLTWNFSNTTFELILGNLFYPFLGSLSRAQRENPRWIVYARDAELHQTLGTANLGGQHERMHLLQARSFGPLLLPLYAISYVVTCLTQVVWAFTLGGQLYLLEIREKPNLRPPSESVFGGFWGWIYYATPFELWAYASGNS